MPFAEEKRLELYVKMANKYLEINKFIHVGAIIIYYIIIVFLMYVI
jgi:hypothetical protein